MTHGSGSGLRQEFIEDSAYVYENWQEESIGDFDTKLLDRGSGKVLFQTSIARHLEPFWVPILRHFEKHRRVVTYQRRESTTKYLHAWNRAKDLKSVLDHLGMERCDFVSHSSGAIATLHFALMYPERVNSMVLMNVAAHYPRLQGPAGWRIWNTCGRGSRIAAVYEPLQAVATCSTTLGRPKSWSSWRCSLSRSVNGLPLRRRNDDSS